jgi:hypothetical protein
MQGNKDLVKLHEGRSKNTPLSELEKPWHKA